MGRLVVEVRERNWRLRKKRDGLDTGRKRKVNREQREQREG